MFFNSLTYFLFLPAVFLVFWMVSDRFRWLVLLLASICFYATLRMPHLLLMLLSVTTISYAAGRKIGTIPSERGRTLLFWVAVSANILIMAGVRSLPFLSSDLNHSFEKFFGSQIISGGSLISIGVSYYVFQSICYLADIYLGLYKPEHHFGYFALYLSFFPKLFQGPIERAADLLPQLRARYVFDENNVRSGLILFAGGLFKKVVIADRLALYVNVVYGDVHNYSGFTLVCATYFYALQILFDFSGYTDMALGTARIFNINLTQNFNAPYLATSIAEFWRRWHISFSRWILDYIFKPLQFEFRCWKTAGTALALVITFLISGLWHGASWCFVAWGGLHGLYLAVSVFYKPLQKRIHRLLKLEKSLLLNLWQRFITFHLVCFAWIFFRAQTLDDALYVVTHLHTGFKGIRPYLLVHGDTDLLTICALLLGFLLINHCFKKPDVRSKFASWPIWCRWAAYYGMLITIILFNVDSDRAFIYLQF